MFNKGDIVAIAASGGKDSTVLAQVLKTLNERYNYELKLVLLSIDEGITGKNYTMVFFWIWRFYYLLYIFQVFKYYKY